MLNPSGRIPGIKGLNWPLTSISPGRCPCLLLQAKSCTAFPFVFIILWVGNSAPFHFFLTSLQRPKIILCLALVLMSSQSRPWMTLWMVTGMNSCCAPSQLLRSISRMEQYHRGISVLLMSIGVRKKGVSRNTISFWP